MADLNYQNTQEEAIEPSYFHYVTTKILFNNIFYLEGYLLLL